MHKALCLTTNKYYGNVHNLVHHIFSNQCKVFDVYMGKIGTSIQGSVDREKSEERLVKYVFQAGKGSGYVR